MTFYIREDYYGGFKASETRYIKFNNLMEGWAEYKRLKSKQFYYDDAYYSVSCFVVHNYTVELKPQRYHAREKWQWEKMQETQHRHQQTELFFNDKELAFLLNLADDIII